jgi:hypothetical protein
MGKSCFGYLPRRTAHDAAGDGITMPISRSHGCATLARLR